MRLFLTLFICFQLFMVPIAYSYDTSSVSCNTSLVSKDFDTQEKAITNVCLKALSKQGLPANVKTSFSADEILPMIGGCLMGAGTAVVDEIKSIAFLVELFVKEIPSYAWEKIKGLFSDEDNAVGAVDQLSNSNMSLIDKAKTLAKQYYSQLKNFLSEMWSMVKEEYQGFFCYPKPLQAKILCRLVSDVFLLVFSPSKFLKGAKWAGETAKAARKLARGIMESSAPGVKFSQRMEEAAVVLKANSKAAETTKIISKLDEGSAIVSKEVGGETVHYLQTTVNGQKVLREMVLDEHTKFFSIQGQGKKVIDQLITQGAKSKGAIVLLDVNNLGKVNYFSKGLSAGDEYLSTVSDVIRKVAGKNNVKIFRTGGDEISLFTEGMSADDIYKFSRELSREIVADKRVQKIFDDERKAVAAKIAIAKKAGKTNEVQELSKVLDEVNKFDGSVSIGSRMMKQGDDYASLQTAVNESLSKAKATYKKAKGLPYEKYGTVADDIKLESVDGRIIPPVFRPN